MKFARPTLGRHARSASESAHPELWRGLVGAWIPALGVQGTQLFDLSGNGNHGTLTNMNPATDWVAGRNGWALDFDGNDDYVRVSDSPTLNISGNQITLSMWAFTRDTSSQKGGILKAPSVSTEYYMLGVNYDASPDEIDFRLTTGGTIKKLRGGNVPPQEWTHLLGTYDGSIMRAYINGIEVATTNATGSISTTSADLLIARREDSRRFTGKIGDMLIYNRNVFACEVRQMYVDPLALFRLRQSMPFFVAAAPSAGTELFEIAHHMRGGFNSMHGGFSA